MYNDPLLNLDGTPSTITRDMLTAIMGPAAATVFADQREPGDVVSAMCLPGTNDFGLVLLRDGRVAAVIAPSPVSMDMTPPPMSVFNPASNVINLSDMLPPST